jgi:hypothetical protein
MLKFKKHALAIAVGVLFAAPAFADQSGEGIIYQQDQTNAQATINQVTDDGLPQAAAILQTDVGGALSNAQSNNIATVIQGAVDGANPNVTIDPTGLLPSNTTSTSGNLGTYSSAVGVIVAPDLTDNNTGNAAFAYTVSGQTSNNYALVMQNSQVQSNATVIQANSGEVDNAIAAQESLTDQTLPGTAANAGGPTANLFDNGTSLSASLTDNNNSNPVVVSFTGGALTFNYDGTNDIQLDDGVVFANADGAPSSGNLAIIGQGQHLTFTIANPGVGNNSIDNDDSGIGANPTTNMALVIQDGTNGYASIGQQGTFNTAAVLQVGDSNFAETYQYDDGNSSPTGMYSFIGQAGNTNVAQVYQAGAYDSSSVYQLGDGHTALVDQVLTATAAGQGAIAFIYQSGPDAGVPGAAAGSGNFASIYQHASGL